MIERARLSMQVSAEVERALAELAREEGTTKTEIVRRGLRLMELVRSVHAEGRHIGFVKDRSKLDTEIVPLW